jgi:hypothetical protein
VPAQSYRRLSLSRVERRCDDLIAVFDIDEGAFAVSTGCSVTFSATPLLRSSRTGILTVAFAPTKTDDDSFVALSLLDL